MNKSSILMMRNNNVQPIQWVEQKTIDHDEKTKLHAQIWQKEIEMLEALSRSIVDYAGDNREKFWPLFGSYKDRWRKLFCCQIRQKLNVRCMYQLLYLQELYKCLGCEEFRELFDRLQLAESFVGPLMSYVVEKNFSNGGLPVEKWDKPSQLALGVVFRLTSPISIGFHVGPVKMAGLIEEALGIRWTRDRMRNVRELSKSFETWSQINQETFVLDKDNLIDECNECWPFDNRSVIDRRLRRMPLICINPKHDILALMRPFTRNICTPPIELDNEWLLDFVSLTNINRTCFGLMSLQVMHDKEIIKQWSKLFIHYEPTELVGVRWLLLQCLLSILAAPKIAIDCCIENSPEWTVFSERSSWFVEAYKETYPNDTKRGIVKCLQGKLRPFDDFRTAAIYLAILRSRDELSEDDHLEIIRLALERKTELCTTQARKSLFMDSVAIFQMTLSKDVCRKLLTSELQATYWAKDSFLARDCMDQGMRPMDENCCQEIS